MKCKLSVSILLISAVVSLILTGCGDSYSTGKTGSVQRIQPAVMDKADPPVPENGPVNYVDPFIGTDGNGHTFPGACLPFGMVQLSPDTGGTTGNWLASGWKWCAGYHYSDKSILGFSHVHHSGMGAGDWGDILMMPVTGELKIQPGTAENPDSGYRSRFSHRREAAEPGYYRVYLADYGVTVELTASPRAGFHRYTFHEADTGQVIFDLDRGLGDTPLKCSLEIVGDNRVQGFRSSTGRVVYQRVYFCAEFSRPFTSHGTWEGGVANDGSRKARGSGIGGYVRFDTSRNRQVLARVGISYTGIEEARLNLDKEIAGRDFGAVRESAKAAWNRELSRVAFTPPAADSPARRKKLKRIFYTALYHTHHFPAVFSDVDGSYRAVNNMSLFSKRADGFTCYSDYSLWDTFRAQMPLLIMLQPDRVRDMLKTLVTIYEDSDWLPTPQMFGNFHSEGMIGDNIASVMVDAHLKGIRGFGIKKAYRALWKNAMVKGKNFVPATGYGTGRYGLKLYRTLGYVPADLNVHHKNPLFLVANIYNQATSRSLEYAYADFCLAWLAGLLEKDRAARFFLKRSRNYRHLFDQDTGFMRGKSFTGRWMNEENFSPTAHYAYYVEGNAWQWIWTVMHDVQGLIGLMGGREAFASKLDSLFKVKDTVELTEFFSADIAGMIGQYAHGNEPSHHVIYLYNYAGQPWKAQEMVRLVMDSMYDDTPDGLCGNEDMGQMSSWYIFSAMGLYPVHPGIYVIGSPHLEKARLRLGSGKDLIIEAKNAGEKNVYIQGASLNGIPYTKTWLSHREIQDGGRLTFVMGPKPNREWGSGPEDTPPSRGDIIDIYR